MRVISQHGTVDLPYEQIVVCHAMESVIALYNGEKYVLGEYSSKEKAYKAMEMLRERHTDNVFCREDIQYKAEIMLDEGLNIVREMMMKCEYFRFPKDEDVEINNGLE